MAAHQELSGQLGRYVIVRKLGAGGMGSVYLAEDSKIVRKVALKVPHIAGETNERVLRGGSWNLNAIYCRAAFRNLNARVGSLNNFGFRVVCRLASSTP